VPDCQAKGPAEATLRAAGAGYVLEHPRPDWVECGQGPKGCGMLAIARGTDEHLRDPGYFPERQTWKCASGGSHFIGMWNDARPGPEDLVRARLLDGYWVTMGDGRRWAIPVARAYGGDGQGPRNVLPCSRQLSDDGKWEPGEVLPAYRNLWRHVERYVDIFRRMKAGDDTAIEEAGDFQQESDMIACALAANYRVGPVEVSLLGLVDSMVVAPVVEVLIDKLSLDELSKKVQASGAESTSPGAVA